MRKARFAGALALYIAIAGTAIQPSLAALPPANGESLFRQKSQVCHSVVAARPAGVGPNLRDAGGRKVSATKSNYPTALKQSEATWTRANLDRRLSAPTKMVSGTRMVLSVTDATERAVLIKYFSQTN